MSGDPGVRFRSLQGWGTPIRYELGIAYAQSSPLIDSFVAVALEVGADRGLKERRQLVLDAPDEGGAYGRCSTKPLGSVVFARVGVVGSPRRTSLMSV
jgi:hypothetical protein